LNDPDRRNRAEPTEVPYFAENQLEVVSVDVGRYHSIVLTADGDLYAFGFNLDGQCGVGSKLDYVITPSIIVRPKASKGWTNAWESVRCGISHSIALLEMTQKRDEHGIQQVRRSIYTFGKEGKDVPVLISNADGKRKIDRMFVSEIGIGGESRWLAVSSAAPIGRIFSTSGEMQYEGNISMDPLEYSGNISPRAGRGMEFKSVDGSKKAFVGVFRNGKREGLWREIHAEGNSYDLNGEKTQSALPKLYRNGVLVTVEELRQRRKISKKDDLLHATKKFLDQQRVLLDSAKSFFDLVERRQGDMKNFESKMLAKLGEEVKRRKTMQIQFENLIAEFAREQELLRGKIRDLEIETSAQTIDDRLHDMVKSSSQSVLVRERVTSSEEEFSPSPTVEAIVTPDEDEDDSVVKTEEEEVLVEEKKFEGSFERSEPSMDLSSVFKKK